MALTRLVPRTRGTDIVQRIDREMDRMFGDFFERALPALPLRWFGSRGYPEYFPEVDVRDAGDSYTLIADVPGISRDKLDVNVSNDRVQLKGCYEEEGEQSSSDYYCHERSAGCFDRTIALPGDVKVEDVKASLRDGILTLHLPKVSAQVVKHIPVMEQ